MKGERVIFNSGAPHCVSVSLGTKSPTNHLEGQWGRNTDPSYEGSDNTAVKLRSARWFCHRQNCEDVAPASVLPFGPQIPFTCNPLALGNESLCCFFHHSVEEPVEKVEKSNANPGHPCFLCRFLFYHVRFFFFFTQAGWE